MQMGKDTEMMKMGNRERVQRVGSTRLSRFLKFMIE